MKQGRIPAKPTRLRYLWRRLALLLPLAGPLGAHAQQLPLADSTQLPMQLSFDSLAVVAPVPVDSVRLEWLRIPPTLRDLIGDRMSCIQTEAPHQFNNAVMAYITLFTARNRAYTQRILERENLYFPLFEKYLTRYHLPLELKYLAVVESSLIPTAKSPVGATGLWQFMGPTAGDLHLRRDEWIDERMAPEKATEAACKHLRYLYGVFHDWELVLAAYNWGAGNMQRVMRRTGKKTFWDLYPHLPAETRNYVPTFTAVMYSLTYAQEHGLHSNKLAYQRAVELDTLALNGQAFDLHRLCLACGYSDSTYLTRFNPELFREGLPAGYRPYVVRYPATARAQFASIDRATLLSYCQPLAAVPQPLAALRPRLDGVEPWFDEPALAAGGGPRTTTAAEPRYRHAQHKLRRGETLASVAEQFGVSPAQLRRWNSLPKNRVPKPGTTLVVLVPLPAAAPVMAAPATTTPRPVRPAMSPEEAAGRQALAAANAQEVARLAALAAQEQQQAARLARVKQRQEAAQRAQVRIAAIQAAAVAKATAAAARKSLPVVAMAPIAVAALEEQPADSDDTSTANPLNDAPNMEAVAASTTSVARPRNVAAETTHRFSSQSGPVAYVVRRGDNLSKLADERGVSVAQLMAWNQLPDEMVVPGQRLWLEAPVGAARVATRRIAPLGPALAIKTHLVQPGDTLYSISQRFKVTVEALRRINHLASDNVKLGQKLLVPQG